MELECFPLDVEATPAQALRALRGDAAPFALTGRWSGSRAILGSEPIRVAPADASALEMIGSMDELGGGYGSVGGGWFGYLGFGLGGELEALNSPPPRPHPLPLAGMAFYDHVLRLDPRGRWWFEALATPGRRAALDRRRVELEQRLSQEHPRRPWQVAGLAPRPPGYDGHVTAVRECLERIAAGDIFQANICLRLEGSFSGSALDAFADAAERLDPPLAAFFELPDGAILSFSPELFLRRRGRLAISAPIKGTAARSDDPELAREQREQLEASIKDTAENVMIVDLMRNDLGRVSSYGSVSATPPTAEPHPGVWHLVSEVRGTLHDGVTDADLLKATFPPGSVTGAPKIQAIKVIHQLEPSSREIYTGAIGFLSPVAGVELNVAIRTFEISGDRIWIGSGGGIVADSDPEQELEEALRKARPLVAALGGEVPERSPSPGRELPPVRVTSRPDPARGLLETIAVSRGFAVELNRHLERLERSARSVYGLELPQETRSSALEAAAGFERELGRMRILARPDGGTLAVSIAIEPLPAGGALTAVSPRAPASPGVHPAAAGPSGLDRFEQLQVLLLPGGLGEHKWADRSWAVEIEGGGATPLLVDADGCVLEAGSANLWILERGSLVTPVADGRLLPGIVRAALLTHAPGWGYEASEQPIDLERARNAEAIVLTSSIRIVRPARLGSRQAPATAGLADELAARLRAALMGAIELGR